MKQNGGIYESEMRLNMFLLQGISTLADSYKEIASNALVGIAFVRSILGTILVFVICLMIDGMGLYDMFVFLGVLSFAISALSVPMIILGKRSRVNCAAMYKEFAATQYGSSKNN